MPVNTITVGAAVAPTIIETYISHYLKRGPLKHKPTAHISYHEGLELIRRFLHYASLHPVDELQAFTSQWVPVPHWVHVDRPTIPDAQLKRSADLVRAQLGPQGIESVGGHAWWEWRREGSETLQAEWIEMRKDREDRLRTANPRGQRIMLYVHGGAYYFGSVDEHRYQMQRHARKLKARLLAPKYRLAPQFPFPCALVDCLAAYLWLLDDHHHPNTIVLAGDSAGGGMVLTMLVVMRDQGIPLPAAAVLLSPWVDLTHSFPSLAGDGKMDYIPPHGFLHKPSMSWPPPNADDLLALDGNHLPREESQDRVRAFSVTEPDHNDLQDLPARLHREPGNGAGDNVWVADNGQYSIGPKSMLSLQLDGKLIEIKDQIQMYAQNHMLTHPLVSPVLQPSLGGLPPLLIQVGGGELLRDEQIYLAHKAAQPLAFLPPPSNHQTAQHIQVQAARYKPTNVQLQLWDDLCHVAPTLSFTRPAKHMYRGVAQFAAWALARAQKTSIDIMDDESISVISSDSASSAQGHHLASDDIKLAMPQSAQHVGFESTNTKQGKGDVVGRAGDPIPPFENHMIRQRVDRHGRIYPLAPPTELEALKVPRAEVGVPKKGPVTKWMKAQQQWNGKFAKQKLKIQRQRMQEMEKGYERFEGELPPPTALAGRRVKGMKKEPRAKKSWGMALWSLWGSKHDEATIGREEKADQASDQEPSTSTVQPADDLLNPEPTTHIKTSNHLGSASIVSRSRSRSRSRHSDITDRGQIASSTENLARLAPPNSNLADVSTSALDPDGSVGIFTPTVVLPGSLDRPQSPPTLIPETDTLSTRPTRGGVAYPFRLKVQGADGDVNGSMVTLQSMNMTSPGLDEKKGYIPTIGAAASGNDVSVEHTIKSAEADTMVRGSANLEASETSQERKRPTVERFVTSRTTAQIDEMDENGTQRGERPVVERFETARDDLSNPPNVASNL